MKRVLFLFFVILLSSCATSTNKTYEQVKMPEHDGLRIIMYRKPGAWGYANETYLRLNQKDVAHITNGMYTVVDLPKGGKYIMAIANIHESLYDKGSIEIKEKNTIYLRIKHSSVSRQMEFSDWQTVWLGSAFSPNKGKNVYQAEKIKDGYAFYNYDVVAPSAALNEIRSLKLKYSKPKLDPIPVKL